MYIMGFVEFSNIFGYGNSEGDISTRGGHFCNVAEKNTKQVLKIQ